VRARCGAAVKRPGQGGRRSAFIGAAIADAFGRGALNPCAWIDGSVVALAENGLSVEGRRRHTGSGEVCRRGCGARLNPPVLADRFRGRVRESVV
jgi:hypothetical protein